MGSTTAFPMLVLMEEVESQVTWHLSNYCGVILQDSCWNDQVGKEEEILFWVNGIFL